MNLILNKLVRDKQPAEVIEAAKRRCSVPPQTKDAGVPALTSVLDKKPDELDITAGLNRFNGDEGKYLAILRSYVSSVGSMLPAMKETGRDKLGDYRINVHGIKGASRDIFARQIAKDAEKLENAADAGDLGYIGEHNPLFLDSLGKFLNSLETMLGAVNGMKSKPKKDKPDADLLLKLRDACKRYNIESADAAMAEIEKYQYEADGGLTAFLRSSVDMMQYGQIVKKLSETDSLG